MLLRLVQRPEDDDLLGLGLQAALSVLEISGRARKTLVQVVALGLDYGLFIVGLSFASQATILPAFAASEPFAFGPVALFESVMTGTGAAVARAIVILSSPPGSPGRLSCGPP